jgi:preprotein translocase subunit SecA
MAVLDTINKVLVGVFGSRNERVLKEMMPTVARIGELEPKMMALSDADLRKKTDEFRDRLTHGETLDDLLPEAFAVVREASRRIIFTPDPQSPVPMRHFDVQIVGAIVLHTGTIAEMATGEGKTLVATPAVYLNALPQKGVHMVTTNDYLAQRDRDWMGPLYEFLGLTAGVIYSQQDYREKQAAYACDITFGKDSEFGFDYLRDNMRTSVQEQVQQRGLNFAIVDEVDNILIDEARTPLIISGASEESTEKYYQADRVATRLTKGKHFEVKEKDHVVFLTEDGTRTVEKALGVDNIYAGRNSDWPHYIEQALRAHHLQKRDVQYVVKNGEVIIVDEFTGRLMPGRRWSDGLHQAVEAKERLKIKEENQTDATVTYQHYFRMYKKLAGMTGTALTEAPEFYTVYKLDVTAIPTNRPLIRWELSDLIYGTEKEKYDALEEEIVRQHGTGRPLLVGTVSIEKSELLSERLVRRGIKHEVLNAKHHEREAMIVAKAGQLGNVTISTNMAGRGTDIVLGTCTTEQPLEHWKESGVAPKDARLNMPADELQRRLLAHWAELYLEKEEFEKIKPEQYEGALNKRWRELGMFPPKLTTRVADLGGLYVVGTERHEARRIDNQLRGRSGRQGDPGSSRFFLSLEDDLMRIFASETVTNILRRIGMSQGMALEHPMVTRAIERAQKKREEHNFDMRKYQLEYGEVMDEQRKATYGLRQRILENTDIHSVIMDQIRQSLDDEMDKVLEDEDSPEQRNFQPVAQWAQTLGATITESEWRDSSYEKLREIVAQRARERLGAKGDDRTAVSEAVAGRVFALLCDRERPFPEWDLTGLEAWGQRSNVTVAADIIRGRLTDAVARRCVEAIQKRFENATPDEALQALLEDASDRYLAESLPSSEWDLDGLTQWSNAMGVSLPVNQWREEQEEPTEAAEAADFEKTRRQEVRTRILERSRQQLRSLKPADMIAKLVNWQSRLLLAPESEEGEAGYRPVATWLSRAPFNADLSEGQIRDTGLAEAGKFEQELATHVARLDPNATPEAFALKAFGILYDAYMFRSLSVESANFVRMANYMARKYGIILSPFDLSKLAYEEMGDRLDKEIADAYQKREQALGPEKMRLIERFMLLMKLDMKWRDHLHAIDHLREGIGLRGYGQLDPKMEYTREARQMFDEMQSSLREEVTDLILKVDIGEGPAQQQGVYRGGQEVHAQATSAAQFQKQRQRTLAGSEAMSEEKRKPIVLGGGRVGRNDPCPCGSGKKYKQCCGKAAGK